MTTPRNSATRRARGGRTFARLATATAVAVLATGALTGVAGAVGSAESGSTNLFGSADGPARTATITHGNLSITREIVGNHTVWSGGTIKFRTTISALDGPAREITRIREAWPVKSHLEFRAATVTYTAPTGDRVTEPADIYGAVGSFPVDAATGATVVHESTFTAGSGNFGIAIEPEDRPTSLGWPVSIAATDLEYLNWRPSEVTAECLYDCQLFGPLS